MDVIIKQTTECAPAVQTFIHFTGTFGGILLRVKVANGFFNKWNSGKEAELLQETRVLQQFPTYVFY